MIRAIAFAALYWILVALALTGAFGLLGHWSTAAFHPRLLTMLILIQTALLVVPSRWSAGRPVSRLHLLIQSVVTGLLLGLLLFGLEMAIGEYTRLLNVGRIWMIGPVAVWVGYPILMSRRNRNADAGDVLHTGRRTLLIAGMLALLVIIPTHMLMTVRRSGVLEGIGTMFGMILGVLVLLQAVCLSLFARVFPRR